MKKMIFFFMILGFMMGGCSQSEMDLQIPEKTAEINDPNFVSVEDAMKNVEQHYAATFTDKATRAGLKVRSVETFRDLTRANSGDDMYGFYIINFEDNMGFSIASADARRIPIYAISDEGSLALSDTIDNKGLSWYINQYMPLSSSIIPPPGITPPIKDPFPPTIGNTTKTVYSEPLLKGYMSRFTQGFPYNQYCFTADGNQAVTGCVPLAIGTVIGYYEWPSTIEGYSFDWEAMKNNRYHDSWCRLFEILGRKDYANAIYGVTATSAYPSDIPVALIKVGYKNPVLTSFYSGIVNDELKTGNPVLCGGYTSDGGHRWVIDGGYMIDSNLVSGSIGTQVQTYYYHCVWGWFGTANGYYELSTKLGGNPSERDPATSGNAPEYYNLNMVYGYRPK